MRSTSSLRQTQIPSDPENTTERHRVGGFVSLRIRGLLQAIPELNLHFGTSAGPKGYAASKADP